MLWLVVLLCMACAWGQETDSPPTTSVPITPTPAAMGNHYRPYFFHDHPNICGRVPEWYVMNQHGHKTDYYDINGGLNIIYLVEAWCGTCQSNAHIAGLLAKRWETRYHVDMKMIAINKDVPRARAKLAMMRRRTNSVRKYVEVLQDNSLSHVWDLLGNYIFENAGEFGNETIAFTSKRNDMYLVDNWGRIIRFLRDGILNRGRPIGFETQINWRDTVLNDFKLAKNGQTVCDELKTEQLLCRVSEEWSLNGRSFRNLRAGTSLTILIFIRADLEKFTTEGIFRDAIALSKEWQSPSYVVIVDSLTPSQHSFATVDFIKQKNNADITLLLDENNMVSSQYMSAPGDLIATDELGRIIGIFNRADLSDLDTVQNLKSLHVNWNPDCDAFIEYGNDSESRTGTYPTTSPLHTTSSRYF